MAYVAGLRGMHSTGVFQGRSFGTSVSSFLVDKKADDVATYMWFNKNTKEGDKRIMNGLQNNFFCVHTRQATRGRITEKNAHPFNFENIVGCHNGTLTDLRYQDHEKTDSELLLKDINDDASAPEKILKKLSSYSAYVVVYLNKNTGELYFIRNKDRELFVAQHKNRGVIYWASESWMIREMAKRNDAPLVDDEVLLLEDHMVFRIHPGEIKSGNSSKAIWYKKKFVSKPLVQYQPPVHPYRGVYKNGSWNYNAQDAARGAYDHWPRLERKEEKEDEKSGDSQENFFQKLNTEELAQENKSDKSESKDKTKDVVKNERGLLLLGNIPKVVPFKEEKIPKFYCCQCQEKMSLVDVYFAKKLSPTVYIHEDCLKQTQNELFQEQKIG